VVKAAPDDERQLVLTDEGTAPIPLRIVPRKSDRTWQEVAQQELNRHFPDDSCNLTRAVWVRGAQRSELVFGQHHVTCDALSFTYAVRDLLSDLAELERGEAMAAVEALPIRPPLPSLLPPQARGWGRFRQMSNFFYKNVLMHPLRRPRKLPLERLAPPGERRSGLCHGALPPATTTALATAAREQGTTVHAALCAALILGAAEQVFAAGLEPGLRKSVTLGCASGVNLRRELDPALAEEMGLYVSQVTTFHRLLLGGLPPTLWELAREVKEQLSRTLARGEQYLTMPMIGLFIPYGRQPGPGFVRRFDGGSPAAICVTNIGPLPIPVSYGPFVVEDCQFLVSPSVVTPIIVCASTYRQVLNLNLVHVEPLCSRQRAAAILGRAVERLHEAVELTAPAALVPASRRSRRSR
jgi:hypothetical protein